MSDEEFGGFEGFGDDFEEALPASQEPQTAGDTAPAEAQGDALGAEAMGDDDVQDFGGGDELGDAGGFGFGFEEAGPSAAQLAEEMSKANAEEAAATTTAATTAAATPTAAPSSGGAEEQSKGLEAAIPRVPEGVKPTSVAASLNRHCLAVSQPFTAGADLISSTRWENLEGLSLQTVIFNVCMSAPGTFSLSVSTGPNATGEVLAIEKGVEAPAKFTQVKVTFANPPQLEAKKVYYFLLRLERGAFKFQATAQCSEEIRASAFTPKNKAWGATQLAFVFRSTYAKALPKRGEVSGMATIRITPRNKGSRRLSLKTNSAKKRFLVLEENALRAFKGPDAGLIFNIPCEKIETLEVDDAIDSTVFSVVTPEKIYQVLCSAPLECKRWVTALRATLKKADRGFGAEANTNMMF